MSERGSERSERASERVSAAEGASEASSPEQANERAVRANERTDERVAQYCSLYSWLLSTIVWFGFSVSCQILAENVWYELYPYLSCLYILNYKHLELLTRGNKIDYFFISC